MFFRVSVTFVTFFGLVGCASTYKQPSTEGEFATITFEKGYLDGVGFGTSSAQEYAVIGEKGCKKPQRLAYMTWTSSKEKPTRVASGEKIEIIANNINFGTNGGYWNGYGYSANVTQEVCQSKVAFTPEDGKNYHIKLVEKSATDCVLEFKDVETSLVPEQAVIEDSYICEE